MWFGAAHAPQLLGVPLNLLIVTMMGFVWTLQRHYSGSLIPGLVTHWVYNASLFGMDFLLDLT